MVFSDFSYLWSKGGHFSSALSKGAKTTTWIWNLHADAHDFDIQNVSKTIGTKIFASNLAHLSLVFFWISGMHFHGAYFANNDIWQSDPKHYLPSAQILWSIIGQDILNSDIGSYFQGMYITSAFFQLWRSSGIITQIHLKYGSSATLVGTIICLLSAYFHMHISYSSQHWFRKFKSLSIHHLALLLGMGSLSWSAHIIHISLPINRFLDSAIDPVLIPWLQDLLFSKCQHIILRRFSIGPFIDFSIYLPKGISIMSFVVNGSTGSIFLGIITAHHLYLAIPLMLSAVLVACLKINLLGQIQLWPLNARYHISNHAQLVAMLLLFSSGSMVFAHHTYSIPCYPYLASDYPTVLSLFVHHINIASLFIIGAGTHSSIFMIRDFSFSASISSTLTSISTEILNHRCIIIGHLSYASIWLGLHAFGMYVHNDSLQALARPSSMFSDNSIQFKPIFTIWVQSFRLVSFDIKILDRKVILQTQELGTADFMVHHIHAFTIHIALLILSKGILYARNSRFISDKSELGFRYPCDGPGRGGTCQVSPYDHLYLGFFWMYNCLSVVIFHFFWKMQSDVWGMYNLVSQRIEHISSGDFTVNSSTINGWLRNFLWSQAAQVIQSYGSTISSYGLIFLISHFVWAFSLMFLFSGRGYWQELIESISYAHQKLKIVNAIQARALSISQGRAVGLTHYILGGIGVTNTFVISRMIALS